MKMAIKSILITFLVLKLASNLFSQSSQSTMNVYPVKSITRISIGYFQSDQTEKVENMLNKEFKQLLVPAIKQLKGNLGYYVAIDKEKHAMTNVSFWQTKEDAMQMATLKEMLRMRETFESLGLKFIEITNHEVLWKLPD
jgi:quinol monooxygenase YgiN